MYFIPSDVRGNLFSAFLLFSTAQAQRIKIPSTRVNSMIVTSVVTELTCCSTDTVHIYLIRKKHASGKSAVRTAKG